MISKFKTHSFVKIICVILVISFITMDITWANPDITKPKKNTDTLATPSMFDPSLVNEYMKFTPMIEQDAVSFIYTTNNIVDYIVDQGRFSEDRVEYVSKGMQQDLGDKRSESVQFDYVNIIDDVLIIPYENNGETFYFQVVQKNSPKAKAMKGYLFDIIPGYTCKVLAKETKEGKQLRLALDEHIAVQRERVIIAAREKMELEEQTDAVEKAQIEQELSNTSPAVETDSDQPEASKGVSENTVRRGAKHRKGSIDKDVVLYFYTLFIIGYVLYSGVKHFPAVTVFLSGFCFLVSLTLFSQVVFKQNQKKDMKDLNKKTVGDSRKSKKRGFADIGILAGLSVIPLAVLTPELDIFYKTMTVLAIALFFVAIGLAILAYKFDKEELYLWCFVPLFVAGAMLSGIGGALEKKDKEPQAPSAVERVEEVKDETPKVQKEKTSARKGFADIGILGLICYTFSCSNSRIGYFL